MPPKRALWCEDDLVAVVQAVQCGRLSTYKAAERYKVPRRTIRNHLQTASLKKSLVRKPLLHDEQEVELVSRIVSFAAIGLPVTPQILRRLVFKFCENNNIKHPFNQQAKVAGKDWFKNFMKRHPDISRRKAQFMNPARAQKLNKFIVDDHFQRLNEVYDKLDLKTRPEKIYNMDEKGYRLTIHHQQTILAQKGAKRVHLQSSKHAESVTIASCVNALGTSIHAWCKGKRLKPELYDNLPPGLLVEKSGKGYMTNELFVEFLKHLARYKTLGKCLLIFDGEACHLDLSIVEVADSLDIALYCLPSNTTHELQPLDKAVYRSFEHHWDSKLLLFMEQNSNKKLSKARFNIIFTTVWSKCMTHNNITSGFRATGLYPYIRICNPHAIPETAFAPSVLSETAAPTPDAVDVENSPPRVPSTPIAPQTPQPSTSMQEQRIDQPPKRSFERFYRMVYGSSTSDDKDNVPLAQVKRISFKQLLPTPAKNNEKRPTVRRKAINHRGTPVTKDLFNKNKIEKMTSKMKNTGEAESTKENRESWYCHACKQDQEAAMRMCCKCSKWYHEECVGLSEEDEDNFKCPDCS